MASNRIKVIGKDSNVQSFKTSLLSEIPVGIEFSETAEVEQDSPFEPRPLGIEPISYFFVSFAAHLAASLVHDWLRTLHQKAAQNNVEIVDIQEEEESP